MANALFFALRVEIIGRIYYDFHWRAIAMHIHEHKSTEGSTGLETAAALVFAVIAVVVVGAVAVADVAEVEAAAVVGVNGVQASEQTLEVVFEYAATDIPLATRFGIALVQLIPLVE